MFKVGDRVRRKIGTGSCSLAYEGKEYTVRTVWTGNLAIGERAEEYYNTGKYSSNDACCCQSDWELISPAEERPNIYIGGGIREMMQQMVDYTWKTSNLTPTPEQNKGGGKIMYKLNSMMKRLLDASTKKLIKAGYMDGDLLLTDKGRLALTTLIFEANKVELVKMAEEDLKEEKEEK